jgi:hypothetical protein
MKCDTQHNGTRYRVLVMLGDANELFMLSIIMLNVVIPSVVASKLKYYVNCSYSLKIKNCGKNYVRECQLCFV